MQQRPSIGRIVHYTARDPRTGWPVTHAAVILGLGDVPGLLYLDVRPGVYSLGSGRTELREAAIEGVAIPHSEVPRAGHWSWPPRL